MGVLCHCYSQYQLLALAYGFPLRHAFVFFCLPTMMFFCAFILTKQLIEDLKILNFLKQIVEALKK
jgi:hypothetical protein